MSKTRYFPCDIQRLNKKNDHNKTTRTSLKTRIYIISTVHVCRQSKLQFLARIKFNLNEQGLIRVIKAKLMKLDKQTNIDKYRVTAQIYVLKHYFSRIIMLSLNLKKRKMH